MAKQKSVIIIVLLAAILFGVPYYLLGAQIVTNPLSTGHLQQLFKQQSAIFTGPITSLGITGQPTRTFQCLDDHTTHLATYYVCLESYAYPNNTAPISTTALASYPANASTFDTLLKQNGWLNDRPRDPVTTLVDSNPYLAQNGGVGAEVPFHKNVGAVSCNLEVTFNSLSDDTSPGSIDATEFSCQQTVRLFMPHISAGETGGI
jgi:hypothetical protein